MSAQHTPGPWEPATGYSDAFYQIGKMLGIPAQDRSPSEVWHEQMRPMLVQRLVSQAELLDALKLFADAATMFEQEYGEHMQPDTGCNIKFSALCAARAVIAKAMCAA